MTKLRTSLMLIALSVTVLASLFAGLFQESEAIKGQGVSLTETGSDMVCGDRLCSEITGYTDSISQKQSTQVLLQLHPKQHVKQTRDKLECITLQQMK
jgi:hypothetical protein